MLTSVRHRLRTMFYYLSLPFLCVLRTIVTPFAIVFFPHCARRMFFVTSLYAELLGIDARYLSKQRVYGILDELNREFSLCKDPNALGIALYFHQAIWKNASVISMSVHRVRKEELAEFCIGFAVSWLKYDTQRMYRDALQLIEVARRDHPLRSAQDPADPVQGNFEGFSEATLT